MLHRMLLVLALLASNIAHSALPEGGWYWNPAEPGRGFNIEIQDNQLFVAAFVYDAQGKPIWLVSGGPMTGDASYAGTLYQTSNGQCTGCPFPGAATETAYGPITITFNGTLATITINGFAFATRRFDFALDFTSVAQPLLGEWAIVSGATSFPIYFAERIAFHKVQQFASGLAAVGSRAGSASSVAVGSFDQGTWNVLMDSSTSYYKFYTFSFAGLNRIEGTQYLFLKTENPTTGTDFIGHRIKSARMVQGFLAPGTGKAAATLDAAEQADWALAAAKTGDVTISAADLARVKLLLDALREAAQAR